MLDPVAPDELVRDSVERLNQGDEQYHEPAIERGDRAGAAQRLPFQPAMQANKAARIPQRGQRQALQDPGLPVPIERGRCGIPQDVGGCRACACQQYTENDRRDQYEHNGTSASDSVSTAVIRKNMSPKPMPTIAR